MRRRKGSPRYKKITGYIATKSGIRTTKRYILRRKPHDYTTKSGEKGTIYAPSKREANKTLRLLAKQKRYSFGDVVVFARNRREAYRKQLTERRRRTRLGLKRRR